MTDFSKWLQDNWWAILIALLTVASTYVIYGYRITTLENNYAQIESRVHQVETTNVQTAVDIAKIQKDIEYMRYQLDRIFPEVK